MNFNTFYMKSLIFTLAGAALLNLTVLAQTNETEVSSTVKEVTVFRTGVQETRNGKTPIATGTSILKFTGLPNAVNPNSIQFKGVENFTILSMQYRLNYLSNSAPSEKTQMILDSMDIITNQLNLLRKKIYVLTAEQQVFYDNRNMVGKNDGLDPDELEEMMMLYGKRMAEIEMELIDRRKEETTLSERYNKLNMQYSSSFTGSKNYGEILITVNAKTKIASSDLVLIYYTSSGGWNPFYDVRAKDTKSDIEITYKANVVQYTGADWSNVKLILSSISPNFSNTLPELANWYLQYGYYQDIYNTNQVTGAYSYTWDFDGKSNQNYGTQQATSVEFIIDKPYSIASDGKEYVVEIGKYNVKAGYQYYAVPKIEESAFILARLTGWYELNLLAGKTNIYFGNSYVGNGYINPEVVEDTLDISLGNDESVIVKRENVSDMNAKNVTGNTKKKTEEWEISIRNNRGNDIRIKILDQIPVSTDKEVVVTPDSYEGSEYKKETGELMWMLDVKTGETQKVRFKYTVKYPKNKIVTNL